MFYWLLAELAAQELGLQAPTSMAVAVVQVVC
jgi:hypothetical protein